MITEARYTAFGSKKTGAVTARLIVHRVKDQAVDQDELFPIWRYHTVFTNRDYRVAKQE